VQLEVDIFGGLCLAVGGLEVDVLEELLSVDLLAGANETLAPHMSYDYNLFV
jgi:hypothetical protein